MNYKKPNIKSYNQIDIHKKLRAQIVKYAISQALIFKNKNSIKIILNFFLKSFNLCLNDKLANYLISSLMQEGLITYSLDHESMSFQYFIDLNYIRKNFNIK